MNKITRTLKHYTYTFGKVGAPDENGKANVEVVANHTSFERLGMRELQKLAKQYDGQLLFTDEKDVKAECSLEAFLNIAELTEL